MFNARPTWSRIGGILVSVMLATAPLAPTVALAASSVDKTETVHVQTDASGNVQKVTVDSLLANDAQAAQVADRSDLTDITPADEDQRYTASGAGDITWTTGGKQVSYKGTSHGTPPVEVSVSYTLDGVVREPSELAGASGHLVIRVDYRNNTPSTQLVGDAQKPLSTPFVCMTAVLLDGDVFSNVEVENGRVIDDKGGLAVIGYALPGLKESLDIDPDTIDLDLPEYLQISADVTDLALDPIYTICTPELFGELDTDDLDLGLDDLDEGTDALQEAMGKLIEGSGALTDALGQLSQGSVQLGGGIAALREALGASLDLLPEGITGLRQGITVLSEGLDAARGLAGQLQTSAQGMDDAAQGALGAVGAAQGSADAAARSVSDLESAVNKGLDGTKKAVDDARQEAEKAHGAAADAQKLLGELDTDVSAQLDEQKAGASAAVGDVAVYLDGVSIEGLEGMSEEDVAALNAQLAEKLQGARDLLGRADEQIQDMGVSVEPPEGLDADVQALDEAVQALAEDEAQIDTSAKALGGAASAQAALAEVQQRLSAASGALQGVAGGAAQLNGGSGALSQILAGTNEGTTQMLAGVDELSRQLSEGTPQLLAGFDQLSAGVGQLTDGLKATADGSGQLTDGLATFDREGISELVSALEDLGDDMDGLTDRLDALREASREYDTFSGKAEGARGSVRFIYKTAQIG